MHDDTIFDKIDQAEAAVRTMEHTDANPVQISLPPEEWNPLNQADLSPQKLYRHGLKRPKATVNLAERTILVRDLGRRLAAKHQFDLVAQDIAAVLLSRGADPSALLVDLRLPDKLGMCPIDASMAYDLKVAQDQLPPSEFARALRAISQLLKLARAILDAEGPNCRRLSYTEWWASQDDPDGGFPGNINDPKYPGYSSPTPWAAIDESPAGTLPAPQVAKVGMASKPKPRRAVELVAQLALHHGYDSGGHGSCSNFEPITLRAFEPHIGKSVVSEFIQREFGGVKAYRAACTHKARLITQLQRMLGELPARESELNENLHSK